MLLKRFIDFFTSLRLTVVCLAFATLLVFIGTLAQVDLGLYNAQNQFFRSFFIWWGPKGADWKIPVFPGGYTLGAILLANLLAAHAKRFKLTKKKTGIFMIHAGIILLLVGQFATDRLSTESYMRLVAQEEGKNYSESSLSTELAIIDKSDPDHDEVVSIPARLLQRRGEIRDPRLPFAVRVQQFFVNSHLRQRGPVVDGPVPDSVKGVGREFKFEQAPPVVKMDGQNTPAATVEIVSERGTEGVWHVSNWATDISSVLWLERKQLVSATQLQALTAPQRFEYKSKTYEIALRPLRYYKPFTIELLQFTHAKYRGTDTPKDFTSRIRLANPKTGEDREVKIYMNNPLRYGGETFYQGSFDQFDPRVSILQVVRNPSWLTPYFAVTIVGLGLLVQFLSHLIPFAKKRMSA